MHKLMKYICDELEEFERKAEKGNLSMSELQYIDTLAHAGKNLAKMSEQKEESRYSNDGSYRNYYDGRGSYDGNSGRGYSRDGYYYDDGGYSNRRGRAMNGRFVSRDGSEMARRLREMMDEAPDSSMRNEIQRLADKMENM